MKGRLPIVSIAVVKLLSAEAIRQDAQIEAQKVLDHSKIGQQAQT